MTLPPTAGLPRSQVAATAAGAANNRQERGDVIGLHAGIHGDIDLARRQDAEEIGIAAIAGQAGRGAEPREDALFRVAPVEFWRGGGENRMGQRTSGTHFERPDRSAIIDPGSVRIAEKNFPHKGLAHHTKPRSHLRSSGR